MILNTQYVQCHFLDFPKIFSLKSRKRPEFDTLGSKLASTKLTEARFRLFPSR